MKEILTELETTLKTVNLEWGVANLRVFDEVAMLSASPGAFVRTHVGGIVAILKDGQEVKISNVVDVISEMNKLSASNRQVAEEIGRTIGTT